MGSPIICKITNCKNTAIINIYGNWVCGKCAVKWDEKQKKKRAEKQMEAFSEMI